MDRSSKSRRERRRNRQHVRLDTKENKETENVLKRQNAFGNKEQPPQSKPRRVQNSDGAVRKDAFKISKPKKEPEEDGSKTEEPNLIVLSDPDDSKQLTHTVDRNSSSSKNLTYQVEKSAEESKNYTYDLGKRPIPAPRRQKSNVRKATSKPSSDTDKDVMEIELDDAKDEESDKKEESLSVGVGDHLSIGSDESIEAVIISKPRQLLLKKSKSLEQLEKEDGIHVREVKSDAEVKLRHEDSDESPAVAPEVTSKRKSSGNSTSDEIPEKRKKSKKPELIERKKEKKGASKMLSSMIKLEKARIPKISSILRDLKEEGSKEGRPEQLTEDEKIDFQMDSPKIPESDGYGRIYVQNKNGFYVKTRDEVFKTKETNELDDGEMEDSTIKTAVVFHKYWSRFMIYFHGLLAGFAFFHAITITTIMVYHKNEIKDFVGIYSFLALKIHFIFYTIITLCIISCFDRLDVGHLNKKHYESAWKLPSMWIIIAIYIVGFVLTFVNHKTEAMFDAHQYDSQTEEKLWDPQVHGDLDSVLTSWYRIVWTRDVSVIIAWMIISLTQCTDFLYLHLVNMIKYTEVQNEGNVRRRTKSIFSLT